MSNGIFSQKMFHHEIFDTGDSSNQPPHPEIDLVRERLLKEDEEILAVIIAIASDE